MPFAAALSVHPVTAHAVGEVTGQVLERLGPHPDLALLFVTRPHAGALEDAAGAIRRLLAPSVLVGCAAESVLGPGLEVEEAPAVSLWAGVIGPVAGVGLVGPPEDADGEVTGWQEPVFAPQALVLLADPYSFPVDQFLRQLAASHAGLPVLGGLASAAIGPGGNRLVLDGSVRTGGAVGAVIGPGTRLTTVVSQGCRPIGRPLVVTRAERNIVYELAGQPALERLVQMAREGMSQRDIQLINQGLHMGLVIDEHKADFARGDFLVRGVLGADQSNGAIAVGDLVEVGTTVQFQVRDADSADEDLRELLASRSADGALLFTCNGRGTRLFQAANHDVGVVGEVLEDPPVAGFFAAGEIGPVGGHNFMHGFTASLALFEDARIDR
jgi:small ligand-binding sensory domain FIST